MKKIFLFFAAVSLLFACDPTSEDISNGGNITAEELKAMSTVTVDKDANGQNGNVITCNTTAPVNAKWTISGKDFFNNYATKKVKLGEHTVTLTGLCADGTVVTADFPVQCNVITNPLERFYIYGAPGSGQEPFQPGAWDAAAMRFSDNEGKHLPFLSDDDSFKSLHGFVHFFVFPFKKSRKGFCGYLGFRRSLCLQRLFYSILLEHYVARRVLSFPACNARA